MIADSDCDSDTNSDDIDAGVAWSVHNVPFVQYENTFPWEKIIVKVIFKMKILKHVSLFIFRH